MKTLSLIQPWASLLIHGIKTVETRSWSTTYRGWLLIHASKKADVEYWRWLSTKAEFTWRINSFDYPLGAIIGKANLIDCQMITTQNKPGEFEQMLGDYAPGRWQWIFGAIERFEKPIPAKGSLGLWEYELPSQSIE